MIVVEKFKKTFCSELGDILMDNFMNDIDGVRALILNYDFTMNSLGATVEDNIINAMLLKDNQQ